MYFGHAQQQTDMAVSMQWSTYLMNKTMNNEHKAKI